MKAKNQKDQKKLREQPQLKSIEKFFVSKKVGDGVRANAPIKKDSYIMSFLGDVIDRKELKRREKLYEERGDKHFYVLETGYKGLSIDPTAKKREYGLALYTNHSRRHANMRILKIKLKEFPFVDVRFYALHDIEPGEELVWDYGDRSVDFE